MKLRELALAAAALAYGRRRRRRGRAERDRQARAECDGQASTRRRDGDGSAASRGGRGDGRIVPEGPPDRRAETLVAALLVLGALFAAGFIVTYAVFSPTQMPNWLLGTCLAGALFLIALALLVVARRLIVTEELEEDYPSDHPDAQAQVSEILSESGSRITRRRLLLGAASLAGAALGVAGITPALSLGPLWYTEPLDSSPWRRGRRLVDEQGRPLAASEIEEETFYTAFPEGAEQENIASPLVVVRIPPGALRLPAGREGWAPQGILAYSKICTHAGCAVALYRTPRFPVVEPQPALVCPCHYSSFDVATGASVIFGPAGRPLPQLPLMIDAAGHLRAAGDFSGRVGPAWWAVRARPS